MRENHPCFAVRPERQRFATLVEQGELAAMISCSECGYPCQSRKILNDHLKSSKTCPASAEYCEIAADKARKRVAPPNEQYKKRRRTASDKNVVIRHYWSEAENNAIREGYKKHGHLFRKWSAIKKEYAEVLKDRTLKQIQEHWPFIKTP